MVVKSEKLSQIFLCIFNDFDFFFHLSCQLFLFYTVALKQNSTLINMSILRW